MNYRIKPSFKVLELLIILLYMNPVGNLVPSYMQILVFFLWLLFALIDREITVKIVNFSSLNLLIFLIIFFRSCFSGKLDLNDYFSPIGASIGRYQLLIYSIIFLYIRRLNRKEKDTLFFLSIFSMAVTASFSIYYVAFIDPLAVRYSMIDQYWGTGDFQAIYAMAVLIGPLSSLVLDKKRTCRYRLFMLISLFIMAICLVLSNLVTSVIIAALSIIVSFYLENRNGVKPLFLGMISIVGIALKNVWADLIFVIADSGMFFWSTADKMRTVADLLKGNADNLNTLGLRMRLAKISLDTFKKNPIWGLDFKDYGQNTIGSHNQWTDDLARFGILGNLLIWWNYIRLFNMSVHYMDSEHIKNALKTVWFIFFVFGFLNPCLIGQVLAVIFIVVPTMNDSCT